MKQTVFTTPCGFKIGLGIDEDRDLHIKSTFDNGGICSFVNTGLCLSEAGAKMLAQKIEELYADS